MNRVLFIFTISFLCGILVFTSGYSIPPSFIIILAAIFLASGIFAAFRYRNYAVLILLSGFMIGGMFGFYSGHVEDRPLYPYQGDSVEAEVLVTKNPEYSDRYVEIEGKVLSVNGENQKEKILIYLYFQEGQEKPVVRVNDILAIDELKLTIPNDSRNEGGFDYRRYLMGKNIYFTANGSAEKAEKIGEGGAPVIRQAREMNAWLCQRTDQYFKSDTGGLLKGILLGDKSTLDPQIVSDFQLSGLSHIMSVSGLHVSLVIMILGGFLSSLRVPRKLRDFILLMALAMFVLITGCSPSVIRAAVMVMVLILSRYALRQHDSLTALSLVALILLIINPMTIYDVGFELSFAATLGIVTMARPISNLMKKLPKVIRESTGVTLAAQLGTLPMMILYFGYVPLLSVVANVLVSFLLSYVYLASVLAICFPVAPMIWVSDLLLRIVILIAGLVARIPLQILELPNAPLVILGLVIISISAMVCAANHIQWRRTVCAIGIGVLLTVGGYGLVVASPGNLEVTFVNVGQGDSALVRFSSGEYILIDNGTEQMAQRELLPYLKRNGVKKLEAVFLSHCHDDHCGGTQAIFENFSVKYLVMPDVKDESELTLNMIQLCRDNGVEPVYVSQGDQMRLGETKLKVVAPKAGVSEENLNVASMILKLEYGESSYLFTGDAELEQTRPLKDIDVDILKVPHHGSANGMSQELLGKTTPEYAVISVGLNNRYGHPSEETLSMMEQADAKVYRTDLDGTVKITSTKDGIHKVTVSKR